jgi:dipeptidyl aminopeptidase/acylaminoacyl peptidase
MKYLNQFVTLLLIICTTNILSGQYPNQSVLRLEDIMKGNDFIGHSPFGPFWSIGGDTLFYYHQTDDNWKAELKAFVPATDERINLTPEEILLVKRYPDTFNPFGTTNQIAKVNNKIVYRNPRNNTIQVLYHQADDMRNIELGAGGFGFFFTKGSDWYYHNLVFGNVLQLTKITAQDKPKSDKYPETWLAKEELQLFEYLRDRKEYNDKIKAQRDERELLSEELKPLYIGKNNNLNPVCISLDSRYAFYLKGNRDARENTEVPVWITEDGFVKMDPARAKVGTYPKGQSLFVLDILTRDTFTVDFDRLPGIRTKPDFYRDYHTGADSYNPEFSKPRDILVYQVLSSADGQVIVADLFSADNKDRWIVRLIPDQKAIEVIDHQHDEAWVGGPGIKSWGGGLAFIGDSHDLFYRSEGTGFAHLYIYNCDTKRTKQLTNGNYEVKEVKLSIDHKSFYLQTNKEHYGVYHWYRLYIDDGRWEQLTFKDGKWDLVWDVREKEFAALYSSATEPTELYHQVSEGLWRQLTKSTSTDFQNYTWRTPEYVLIPAMDGAMVPCRLYKPSPDKDKRAAVIFVHGAGYLQNAHKYWSTYYREYMFHNFLVDNGFTVLDMDYRASSGYGRDWRTGIYRHMGGKDLSDHVDGAKYLVKEHNVRPDAIGIYGGSYGGFITLMALFQYPDVFKCGAALRSVTDWAHYNHGYTANILNTPETDPNSFRKSSPIYFAEGLKGPLLILHGMVDRNVQFQDVVRLTQRLIELEKDNWELAVYPVEDHGFTEYKSWLDEYKRIYKLFNQHLID